MAELMDHERRQPVALRGRVGVGGVDLRQAHLGPEPHAVAGDPPGLHPGRVEAGTAGDVRLEWNALEALLGAVPGPYVAERRRPWWRVRRRVADEQLRALGAGGLEAHPRAARVPRGDCGLDRLVVARRRGVVRDRAAGPLVPPSFAAWAGAPPTRKNATASKARRIRRDRSGRREVVAPVNGYGRPRYRCPGRRVRCGSRSPWCSRRCWCWSRFRARPRGAAAAMVTVT